MAQASVEMVNLDTNGDGQADMTISASAVAVDVDGDGQADMTAGTFSITEDLQTGSIHQDTAIQNMERASDLEIANWKRQMAADMSKNNSKNNSDQTYSDNWQNLKQEEEKKAQRLQDAKDIQIKQSEQKKKMERNDMSKKKFDNHQRLAFAQAKQEAWLDRTNTRIFNMLAAHDAQEAEHQAECEKTRREQWAKQQRAAEEKADKLRQMEELETDREKEIDRLYSNWVSHQKICDNPSDRVNQAKKGYYDNGKIARPEQKFDTHKGFTEQDVKKYYGNRTNKWNNYTMMELKNIQADIAEETGFVDKRYALAKEAQVKGEAGKTMGELLDALHRIEWEYNKIKDTDFQLIGGDVGNKFGKVMQADEWMQSFWIPTFSSDKNRGKVETSYDFYEDVIRPT